MTRCRRRAWCRTNGVCNAGAKALLAVAVLWSFGSPSCPELVHVGSDRVAVSAVGAAAQYVSATYSGLLHTYPVLMKSLTAGLIYAGADLTAQWISSRSSRARINTLRVATSGAIGLFCFGPSAHFYFAGLLKVLPGYDFGSLLLKTAIGQIFFGPYVTSIFFAAALWCAGNLTWRSLRAKLAADLIPTLVAGLGYWPIADFIAFYLLKEHFIPPFLNLCAFVWTTFLALQAARQRPANTPAAK